ncbi:GH3 domain-containing protein-like [Diadema antillarum]|uniref:GH3 domain-containing protein-like n=1 Tax=Diadema antillarum TaxID=105358 RepID=UPI003A8558E4
MRLGVPVVAGCTAVAAISYDFKRLKKAESHTPESAAKQYAVNKVFEFVGRRMSKALDADSKRCQEVQQEILLSRLQSASDTIYGKQFYFSEIKSPDEYCQKHPLTRADHYKPFVQQIANGTQKVLTKDDPIILAVTSGTSGHHNLVPMIKAQTMYFLLNGVTVCLDYLRREIPETKHLRKTLKIFYNPKPRQSPGGVPIGPNSATPKASQHFIDMYSTPMPAFDITTEREALYAHLLFALADRDIGAIEANFVPLIHNAFVELEENWKQLVTDIEVGEVDPKLDIPEEIREKLNAILTADPERATELREEFEKGFDGIAKRIWPNVQVILAVDSGAFQIYGKMLREKYTKGIPIYSCLYAASEGLIGINIWPHDDERRYLLVPRSMFCEFIPIEHSDEDQPSTLLMNEVEKGATYELVLTNMSGFYRYRFGDVVRVTDFYNKAPVVEFLYRQGQLLNLRGEKMSEDVMYQTIQKTIGDWGGVTLSDYTTMESPLLGLGASDKCPHYEVFLELEGRTPSSSDLTLLDQNLRESSFVYNSFREKGSISPIRVHLMRPGTFRKLREHLLANTQASINQIKIPRVLKVDAHAQILLDSEVV